MEFGENVKLPEHSHAAQVGIVLGFTRNFAACTTPPNTRSPEQRLRRSRPKCASRCDAIMQESLARPAQLFPIHRSITIEYKLRPPQPIPDWFLLITKLKQKKRERNSLPPAAHPP
jgi:hypothetical protein